MSTTWSLHADRLTDAPRKHCYTFSASHQLEGNANFMDYFHVSSTRKPLLNCLQQHSMTAVRQLLHMIPAQSDQFSLTVYRSFTEQASLIQLLELIGLHYQHFNLLLISNYDKEVELGFSSHHCQFTSSYIAYSLNYGIILSNLLMAFHSLPQFDACITYETKTHALTQTSSFPVFIWLAHATIKHTPKLRLRPFPGNSSQTRQHNTALGPPGTQANSTFVK